MAGGLVANVALNAKYLQSLMYPDLFVFPNMGDAGLSAGAAYLCGGEHFEWKPKIDSVYWGPDITNATSMNNNNVECRKSLQEELLTFAGTHWQKAKIVARAVGKMEYGPRALRTPFDSLLRQDQTEIHTTLNRLLNEQKQCHLHPS